MTTLLDRWPHKWFGLWKEYGEQYNSFPSVYDYVFPEVVASYNMRSLQSYLNCGIVVVSTSRANFPHAFNGSICTGSISFRSDGEWLWFDDLPEYVAEYNVALPTSWITKIQQNDYKFPTVLGLDVEKLDWPKFL